MSLLCRLKNLVRKGELEEKDLKRIVIIPKDVTNGDMMRIVYPNMRIYESGLEHLNVEVRTGEYPAKLTMNVSSDWWNSIYRKE